MDDYRRYSARRLRDLVEAITSAAGSEPAEAERVAEVLVEANLAGHDSHGVRLLPSYIDNVQKGVLFPNRHVQVVGGIGPILILDGQRGYGQVIGGEAMDLGMERAEQHGVCVVALRNSHHCGRIGEWAERCARGGFASIHFLSGVSHEPVVAPYGGRERRLLTNPFCAALPARNGKDPAIMLDMATSKIAFGKVNVAHARGLPVPEGCLLDANGRMTTDPTAIVERREGAAVAFGEHKGSGLGIMNEMLGSALIGAPTIQPGHPRDGCVCNNMLSIILKPAAFGDPDAIAAEVEAAKDWIKSSAPAEGFEEVLLPGEPEQRARADRGPRGIPLEERTRSNLLAAGARVGLAEDALARLLDG